MQLAGLGHWGASRQPTVESGPLQQLLSEPTVSCNSSRGRVQHKCAGRTPGKPVCAPESLNHPICMWSRVIVLESGKGRRWCFSTVIKINRAASAVCAAVSVWGWAESFYFYSVGINTSLLWERGRLWLTKITQWFEIFLQNGNNLWDCLDTSLFGLLISENPVQEIK